MEHPASKEGESASELISKRIAELDDWRGETLGRIRALIKEADPDILEEWKWMGTPVWSHDGIVCTGESYKKVVKMTFAKGASLKDPSGLFNSSLDGQRATSHRHPRGREDQSACAEGAHPRGRGAERRRQEEEGCAREAQGAADDVFTRALERRGRLDRVGRLMQTHPAARGVTASRRLGRLSRPFRTSH